MTRKNFLRLTRRSRKRVLAAIKRNAEGEAVAARAPKPPLVETAVVAGPWFATTQR